MKKVWNFLRSMRFGMILLAAILTVSFVGSVIPQGSEASYYVEAYPDFHSWIFRLGWDHLFSTWYFVTMVALLCVNLLLCSIIRVGRVRYAAAHQAEQAAAKEKLPLTEEQSAALKEHLRSRRYRETPVGEGTVYTKNRDGFYGSFLTHLGILLVFVVGGCVLYFSDIEDVTVYPGETLTLSDGVALTVEEFHIEDETGRLDYASRITLTAPDGTAEESAEIRVNRPHGFRGHKFYQQTYGTCGSVTVRDADGGEDTFTVDEVCFLTADGETGVWYEALYPGYIRDEEGNFTLITSTEGEYPDPVYQVLVCGEEGRTPVLAMVGEEITVGELTYTFNKPVSYPGIRIKTLPAAAVDALYAVFALLVLALWLTFFHTPAAVAVWEDGYAVSGSRTMGLEIELAALFEEEDKEELSC